MPADTLVSLLVIMFAAVVAPVVAYQVSRWVVLPAIVLELLLGVLVGPNVLGWARVDDVTQLVADLGLALLMFMAGYEIDFARIGGRALRLSVASWLVSVGLGLLVGLLAVVVIGRERGEGWIVVGLALTTTALGAILPIVRDSGRLNTPFGGRILAIGSVGEFGPIVAVALVLSRGEPLHQVALMVVFAALGLVAAVLAARPTPERVQRLLSETLGTSAQLAVRVSLLVIIGMVGLARALDLDVLLGAFTAGVVVRLAIRSIDQREVEVVESKLDAIAFGFLIPMYFVVSGMKFELLQLVTNPTALLAMVVFVPAFLLVRGLPVYLGWRRSASAPEARSLALLAATALPLVVAITDTGVSNHDISPSTGASLVGAAMISVLFFPMIALRQLRSVPDRFGRTPGVADSER